MAKTMSGTFWMSGLVGLVALAALGCGDEKNPAEFVGTWNYTSSDARLSCPNEPDTAVQLPATKRWGGGVKSDLVDLSSSCNYRFDIGGKVATIQKDQTCRFDDGGGTATEAPNSWLFTLNSATTAEEMAATVITFSDGTPCTFTVKSSLEKISKD
jgi:hypothetical protein